MCLGRWYLDLVDNLLQILGYTFGMGQIVFLAIGAPEIASRGRISSSRDILEGVSKLIENLLSVSIVG